MPSQNTKNLARTRKSSNLEEIKKGFDPNYFYIIFEGTDSLEYNDEFEKINLFLRPFKGVAGKELHTNKKEGKLYLVVKLDPKHSDSILDELYSIELSREFTFYFYGARPKD